MLKPYFNPKKTLNKKTYIKSLYLSDFSDDVDSIIKSLQDLKEEYKNFEHLSIEADIDYDNSVNISLYGIVNETDEDVQKRKEKYEVELKAYEAYEKEVRATAAKKEKELYLQLKKKYEANK